MATKEEIESLAKKCLSGYIEYYPKHNDWGWAAKAEITFKVEGECPDEYLTTLEEAIDDALLNFSRERDHYARVGLDKLPALAGGDEEDFKVTMHIGKPWTAHHTEGLLCDAEHATEDDALHACDACAQDLIHDLLMEGTRCDAFGSQHDALESWEEAKEQAEELEEPFYEGRPEGPQYVVRFCGDVDASAIWLTTIKKETV